MFGAGKDEDEEVIESDRAIKELDSYMSDKGVLFEVHQYVRGNEPAQDIIQAVEEFDGQLVVIALRKRTSAGKFLLGSNAHDILMNAPCPVMTIRAD
jgi:nucleotide-binding universal stress UspA family protein